MTPTGDTAMARYDWYRMSNNLYTVDVTINGQRTKAQYVVDRDVLITMTRDADAKDQLLADARLQFAPTAQVPSVRDIPFGDVFIPAPSSANDSASRVITARYPGTCRHTGQRYPAGTRIEETAYGWAIAGTELDVVSQMDREDSPF